MAAKGTVLTKADLRKALLRAGVEKGGVVMFHSALSALGYIKGGERAVVSALKETVGKKGTIVMPVFTYSGNRNPFHHKKSRARTGRIPEYFRLQRAVFRSKSPTHSVAAWGRLARSITRGHAKLNPYDRNGPFGKLYDLNAHLVFFGCQMYANSMLHAVEDWHECPYLAKGKIRYYDGSRIRVKTYSRLPPGHRDLYQQSDSYTAKIYRVLYKKKLIQETRIGKGYIRSMKVQPLVDACLAALDADPDILLCDRTACEFCRKHKKHRK